MSSATKLRLMCSYGGQILPRPNTKTLYYSGGDTRIISIPRASTACLSLLTSHLSSALSLPTPFTIKYQLPNHDLDTLISLYADDDLFIMLDELDFLNLSSSSSPAPARIRLYIFGSGSKDGGFGFCHPKRESWFVDALRNSVVDGKDCDGGGGGGGGGAESVVLETSSSFGSTSSSVSLSNLPPLKGHGEDSRSLSTDSTSRDSSYASSLLTPRPKAGAYNDQAVHVTCLENFAATCNNGEERKVSYAWIQNHNTLQNSGYAVPVHFDHLQPVQYIPTSPPYVVPSPVAGTAVSSYYPVYYVQPHINSLLPFNDPTHQTYPVPFVGHQTQPYNVPVQGGVVDATTAVSSKSLEHPVPSPSIDTQELVSLAHVPCNTNKQNSFGDLCQLDQQSQPFDVASEETNEGDESDDSDQYDGYPARLQIYQSQPLQPTFPSQYQSMADARTMMLPDSSPQLNTDSREQQIKAL